MSTNISFAVDDVISVNQPNDLLKLRLRSGEIIRFMVVEFNNKFGIVADLTNPEETEILETSEEITYSGFGQSEWLFDIGRITQFEITVVDGLCKSFLDADTPGFFKLVDEYKIPLSETLLEKIKGTI